MWYAGVSLVTWFLLRDGPAGRAGPVRPVVPLRGRDRLRQAEAASLKAFRFPFVAFRSGKGRVRVWGRTPDGDAGQGRDRALPQGQVAQAAHAAGRRERMFVKRIRGPRKGSIRARAAGLGRGIGRLFPQAAARHAGQPLWFHRASADIPGISDVARPQPQQRQGRRERAGAGPQRGAAHPRERRRDARPALRGRDRVPVHGRPLRGPHEGDPRGDVGAPTRACGCSTTRSSARPSASTSGSRTPAATTSCGWTRTPSTRPSTSRKGIERLQRDDGVEWVTGPQIPHGVGPWSRRVAIALPRGWAPAARRSGRRARRRTSTPACSPGSGSAPRSTSTAAGTTAGP